MCTFDVTILDNQAPTITCPSNVTQPGNRVVNYNAATATDNSGVSPTIAYSAASGSQFSFGETTVTVTATDGSGNEAQCTFLINVVQPNIGNSGRSGKNSDGISSGNSSVGNAVNNMSGEDNNGNNNVGIIVGIVVGLVVIAGTIVGVITLVKCKRQNRFCFKKKLTPVPVT